MSRIFKLLQNFIAFLTGKSKNIGVVILLIVSIVLGYMNARKSKTIYQLRIDNDVLSDKLKTRIKFERNKLLVTYRKEKEVERAVIEIPDEGKVDILIPRDGSNIGGYEINPFELVIVKQFEIPESDGIIVRAKIGGLTFKPGFGLLYDYNLNDVMGQLDCKIFFYKKLGAIISFDREYISLGISRRIYDVVSFFRNVEAVFYLGAKYGDFKKGRVAIGIRTNL